MNADNPQRCHTPLRPSTGMTNNEQTPTLESDRQLLEQRRKHRRLFMSAPSDWLQDSGLEFNRPFLQSDERDVEAELRSHINRLIEDSTTSEPTVLGQWLESRAEYRERKDAARVLDGISGKSDGPHHWARAAQSFAKYGERRPGHSGRATDAPVELTEFIGFALAADLMAGDYVDPRVDYAR